MSTFHNHPTLLLTKSYAMKHIAITEISEHMQNRKLTMDFRYDWSDPVTASFNYRSTREQALEGASQLGYTLEDIFVRCEYKAQQRNCLELFTTVILSSGE